MMRRGLIAFGLTLTVLAGHCEAAGAKMEKLYGPSFSIEEDTILSGTEPEFSKCKLFQKKYLSGISAKAEVVVYAHSPKWGYVIRLVYVDLNAPPDKAERGTLICWRPDQRDETNFLVDLVGTAADLRK